MQLHSVSEWFFLFLAAHSPRRYPHHLNRMHLAGEFETLIPSLQALDKQKIELHQQMIDILTRILSGPKQNVDYGGLAAKLPKIRAELEDIDHTILTSVTSLVCMSLINDKPDSKNHMSHLIITRAEKGGLINRLVDGFGDAFNRRKTNFIVSAGLVIKNFLDDHQCSDDPWE